jgi:hypothetical protein
MVDRIDLMKIISEHLHEKIMDGSLKPDATPDLLSFIEEAVKNREDYLVAGLATLTRDWEEAMGKDDKSLYTLGLRRAIDLIRGESHKPLGEDFRDFKL